MAEAKGAQKGQGDWKERNWRKEKANSRKGEESRTGKQPRLGLRGMGGPGEAQVREECDLRGGGCSM